MADNELADSLSPYLQQHADNPVYWMEWSSNSLNLARRLDRPILLSIGYSACHWCHVMAHESFENEQTAALMNDGFINIKVDREERPDLDRIYQLAHQLLTGRAGGWPLTVFLDPETQAPFFAGTYFPPEPAHGLISFRQLLERIHQIWSTRRDELREQNLQIQQALKAISQPQPAAERTSLEELAETLSGQLAARFDSEHGGFGQAPKFPQVPLLAFLETRVNDEQSGQMLHDTLDAMARFGLRDHLGGGFFRYCVDPAWEIPHFEKMLSDNALLLGLYARAANRWENQEFETVCHQTVHWLMAEMSLEGGGFAASLDADSPDGEGDYYLWTPQQVHNALPDDQAELLAARFGLDGPANFEGKHWHLVTARGIDELTGPGQDRKAIRFNLDEASRALLRVRRKRTPPGRDDKLLAGWNGLAIENLARAGRLLGQPDWIAKAAASLDATAVRLFGQEPPRAVWRDGKSAQTASLDDHACILLACLELLQWKFESRWFNLARRLARRIDRQFVDDQTGATFFTPIEHEPLLTRPLAFSDDATPAGAALAIQGLARLGHLCADIGMLRTAEFMVQAALGDMQRSPMGHAAMLIASAELEKPGALILIGGPAEDPSSWHESIFHATECAVLRIHPETELEEPPDLVRDIQAFTRPTAIVCSGLECLEPAHSLNQIAERLHSIGVSFHVES